MNAFDIKIQNEINTKLEGINEESRSYINEAILIINKEIGFDNITSIILFGSQIERKDFTSISDCDLLIIFNDDVPKILIKNIEKYLIALENKHNFREGDSKFVNKFFNRATGMFVSHFLTKKKYWDNIIFHKIFRVNRVFSKLFAPKKIVLGSIVSNSSILYGIDLRKNVKKIEISPFDILRSLIMNLIIIFFSIPISVFRSFNSIKYQLEAVKWSLRASNYYAFEDSKSLEEICARFILFEKSGSILNYKRHAKVFYNRFLNLRKKPHPDLGFMLRCPFRILKIHLKGLQLKKIAKN